MRLGGGGFRTRTEGYQRAVRAWMCRECRAEYAVKPRACSAASCEGRKFYHFASRKELRRARKLLVLADHGHITHLEFQPRYPLLTVDVRSGRAVDTRREYRADFRYTVVQTGAVVVEDVKGKSAAADDPLYKLKTSIGEASYGVTVVAVRGE